LNACGLGMLVLLSGALVSFDVRCPVRVLAWIFILWMPPGDLNSLIATRLAPPCARAWLAREDLRHPSPMPQMLRMRHLRDRRDPG
jgi:hypothetical protein